jgi:MSHA biogenesis protein MshL
MNFLHSAQQRLRQFARWLPGLVAMLLVGACANPQRSGGEVLGQINDVLLKSAAERKAPADAMDRSMMPPLAPQVAPEVQEAEGRFDLSVVNAPATQVFMALVSGTRYSMLLPPEISGSLTLNLKDVTLIEALDTIRELYGYEFRIQGRRIFIEPNTVKTRVFQINYLASRRQGSSDLRVSGNSITSAGTTGGAGSSTTATANQQTPVGASGTSTSGTYSSTRGSDASRVSMSTNSDFWGELSTALTAIVGNADGRSVVINASSGVIVVRALPSELRNVDKYLKATQLVAERQVMLEAKILDVTLSEDFQSGINWAAFGSGTARSAIGVAAPGSVLPAQGAGTTLGNATLGVTPGAAGAIVTSALGRGFIGLAFQTANFAALLSFLETQGNVSVLSSPRIATLNNQKAVLKVGTDELFITNITSSTTTTTTGSVSSPSLTLQPYFSGISLDVTPQIDGDGNVILHVHPAVSTVTDKEKVIDLGSQGVFRLPLASSSINETDSIVRVQNGNIVAIGGLMRQEQSSDRSQLPGATGAAATLLGQRGSTLRKRELVILIKPTLIQNDDNWTGDLREVQGRIQGLQSGVRAEQ